MDVIYFAYFNKAYNTVFHNILVSELGYYILDERTTRWVKTGCTGRL